MNRFIAILLFTLLLSSPVYAGWLDSVTGGQGMAKGTGAQPQQSAQGDKGGTQAVRQPNPGQPAGNEGSAKTSGKADGSQSTGGSGEPDAAGSKDHPLVSRMPGFFIHDYDEKEFDSVKFVNQYSQEVSIEGHKYYIRYFLKAGEKAPSELQVVRNVQNAIKKIGGSVLFEASGNKSTMKVNNGGKETWIKVLSFGNIYELTIVEKEGMKQDVIATAEIFNTDIKRTGHTAVYGIYFDTGKSDVKPESDAAIAEIAKLLKTEDIRLYVVGHTDNTGSFDSNMKLSQARAEAVMNALVSKYGINPSRLKAYGVGSLSPVASNNAENGKSKNRRVELVEQ